MDPNWRLYFQFEVWMDQWTWATHTPRYVLARDRSEAPALLALDTLQVIICEQRGFKEQRKGWLDC